MQRIQKLGANVSFNWGHHLPHYTTFLGSDMDDAVILHLIIVGSSGIASQQTLALVD
jgi:hypothetical protein